MKVGEVLLNVIQDINYVNKVLDGDIEIELGEVDEKLIWMTILLLQENRWEKDFWADLLIYISADSISDRVFEYFLSNKIGLEVMAHLQLDDKKLEQLTKYEEAILTLAKRYYCEERYSLEMFADLLVKVGREEIFYQLIKFCNPSSWEKLSALLYYFSKQSNSSEFEDVVNKQIFALELQWSNDEKMLRNAYKDKVAQYNLALSKNMFTPNDILEELSHLKGMNNCKMIRVNSLQTLRIKKNMKKADW